MKVTIDGVEYAPVLPMTEGEGLLSALEVRMGYEFEGTSVRDHLHALLTKLWNDGECFNGKRPFGNSGWEYDLYAPLISAGFIAGELDEDGCIEKMDKEQADSYVFDLITAAFYGVTDD